MLYKKSKSEKLDMNLFKNPTSEYRAAPFWAWNCELDDKELLWQIEQLKLMGFGGFYMHTRSGMATKYLGEEFMDLIKSCTKKAKDEDMLAYLYDEDRWPSGSAGGYVTKTPKFRQRRMILTTQKRDGVVEKEIAVKEGKTYLLGIFDIVLNDSGELKEYSMIENEADAKGIVRYAYVDVHNSFDKSPGWYNGGTYVDTLNKEAMEKFVEITHEKYKEAVGEEFGKTVPVIFTDEPQFTHYYRLASARSQADCAVPWSHDIDESFYKAYGYNIVEKIPELFWELPDGHVSVVRYNFHDHVCERFADAFSGTCGKWCEENGIAFTGHFFGEYTLLAQSTASGGAMRSQRSMHFPGVDMLFNGTEYSTVKQAQSSARQYGREGAMSELYGVTNWDFDFRGHKFQGDWQAAMGITLRVPHLSWVSMKGAAKRDYPASIHYQSPWYKEYSYIEDHFARLNTVLTRGKPVVKVGVIHPIESFWLRYGPEESTASNRAELESKFENIIKWLLFGNIDFDLICEASMPELCGKIDKELSVGAMSYSTIIVPGCETLRKTTVDILNKFIKSGGNVIFAGEAPKFIDAVPNDEAKHLCQRAVNVPFDRHSILKAVDNERIVDIKGEWCESPDQFIYQMRHDGENDYLFIANANPTHAKYHSYGTEPPFSATIKIKGEYCVSLLNTFTGEEEKVNFTSGNGYTTVYYDFYEHDSLLLRLKPDCSGSFLAPCCEKVEIAKTDFKRNVKFYRHEDNVCLLDLAEYALDDGEFNEIEEILRIDKGLREKFGWPQASGQDMQPWAMEKEETKHSVKLRFKFNSEENFENTFFCAEELISLNVNGVEIDLEEKGYYVDKSIKKYVLPKLRKGENVIVAKVPFAKEESLEACYITGEFDVVLAGCEKTLTKARETIGFGDIANQGMPFYSGNITYIEKIQVPKDCNLCVNIANYKGALTKVTIDGQDVGRVVFAPYDLHIENVTAGEHTIEFTLFGNRHNTFGGLHNCGRSIYYGQGYWYSVDNSWSYEYNLKKMGILKSPVITMYNKK